MDKIPLLFRTKDSLFHSRPMEVRDSRLKEAKTNAARCSKDLKKDRRDLEHRERELFQQIKILEKKGDRYKARLVANQIAKYREIGDRNFEAETMIKTRAQVMSSDHKINKGEVEAIKGIRYANWDESVFTSHMRDMKYSERMEEFMEIDGILNEGMDEIYDEAEEARPKYKFVSQEVDSIMREALTGKKECYDRDVNFLSKIGKSKKISINIQRFPSLQSNEEGARNSTNSTSSALTTSRLDDLRAAQIYIDSLDFSLDMVKRDLLKNEHAILGLDLTPVRAFNGIITGVKDNLMFGKCVCFDRDTPAERFQFIPLDGSRSLRELGVGGNDLIFALSTGTQDDTNTRQRNRREYNTNK